MSYAVNILDMLPEDKILAQVLLLPIVDPHTVADVEPGRVDGKACVLLCDDERGKAVVDIIRMKKEKHELRCYHQKPGCKTWARV